ncbi:MAG: hydroxymethylbilane synthase [Balneolaceae bacterium]|nr:hydroxymethylbilane synthase [Balneolaceae bacterium]
MSKNDEILRIGTRDSELATWQARNVADKLESLGRETELVFVKSEGDIDQTTPLSETGGVGFFTKALDHALLDGEVDLAVHSFKDLPTKTDLPVQVAAVLEREDPRDTLIAPGGTAFLEDPEYAAVIATGSNRRRAQWLHRFPHHTVTGIRGNVDTRIRKAQEADMDGVILAAAGLKRIGLEHSISAYLDWMVPAPAQGAIAVVSRRDDNELLELLRKINHDATERCTQLEREFLNVLEGGCSAPAGAYATISNEYLHFKAVALTLDGEEQYEFIAREPLKECKGLGRRAAEELLEKGAAEVIKALNSGS